MAAQTSDQIRQRWSQPEVAPNEAHTLLANAVVYQGAVAILVSGKARACASGVAGSSLLGVALRQYAAGPADLVLPAEQPAVFLRGVFGFPGLAGDLPTEAQIGKAVYFADDQTVKATAAVNDVSGVLRAIAEGLFWVEI